MRVSDRGIAEIASHEGVVPYPYKDSKGIWTIGVGHTSSAGDPNPGQMPKGVEISMAEVMAIFKEDLRKFEARVNDAVKVPLKQHQFDALVSFDFNTGGIYKAKLTGSMNAGSKSLAADQFMGWSKPPEIIPRRQKEQALFRSGRYSSGGMASVYTADRNGRVNWGSVRRINVLAAMGGSPVPLPPEKPGTPPAASGGWLAAIFNAILSFFRRKR